MSEIRDFLLAHPYEPCVELSYGNGETELFTASGLAAFEDGYGEEYPIVSPLL